jgi:filamentous hemagglutinin family protein
MDIALKYSSLKFGWMKWLGQLGIRSVLTALPLAAVWTAELPAFAQSVIPAADGTATIVTQDGNRFVIDGGSLSGDGTNLFHSFQQLGLSANEIATFLSDPTIQNILGRVVGGDPSVIDGLLQVTGGDSNLFLMNPAGIVFGPNARLDLSGSFSATTATGIEFADGLFDAVETGDFTSLTGNPTAYRFGVEAPGAIVNAGTLSVEPGQGVSLVGGDVINTGTIEAPGGQITVTAVPGTSRVRLQQPGWVVALEVDVALLQENGASAIAPWDLPRLLTEGAPGVETGLALAADGSVELAESGVTVPNEGSTSIVSGQVDAANTASGQTGGEVAVLGDRVGLIGAEVDASGDAGGGRVLVGGEFQGGGTVPNAAETTVSADSEIRADALQSGDGGEVIVWADETADINGSLTARGGEVSGDGGLVETSGRQDLSLTATVDAGAPNGLGGVWLIDPENITIVAGDEGAIGTNIVGADLISNALNTGTSITLDTGAVLEQPNDAAGNIVQNTGADIIKTSGGEVTLRLNADNTIFINGDIRSDFGTLNVILNSDRDASGEGAIIFTDAEIFSNNGNIALGGGQDPLENPARGTLTVSDNNGLNINSGVYFNDSELNSGSGNISIIGFSRNGFFGSGIELQDENLISSNSGEILLQGGGNDAGIGGVNSLFGENNEISSVSGNIHLIGNGFDNENPSSNNSDGILLGDNIIISTQSGSITLEGSGGNNVNSVDGGAGIDFSGELSSDSGPISLIGFGGNGTLGGAGIVLSGSIETVKGSIRISGNGGNGDDNVGILLGGLEFTPVSITSNSGEIVLIGRGSTGSSNIGIILSNQAPSLINIESASSRVVLSGFAGSGTNSRGVIIQSARISSGDLVELQGVESLENSSVGIDIPEGSAPQLPSSLGLLVSESNVVLSADEINLDAPLEGTGLLQLQSMTSGLEITFGGSIDDNRLNFGSDEISNLGNNFDQILFGHNTQRSAFSLEGNVIFQSPIIFQSANVDFSGFRLSTSGNSFNLISPNNITLSGPGTLATGSGGITIEGNNISVDSNLTLDTSNNPILGLDGLLIGGGPGGPINLRATTGGISVGDLDSSGITGGDVSLIAVTEITAGEITTNANLVLGGDGGDVFIDPIGDVQVTSINAQGGPNGVGGTIDITAGELFRAIGSFPDQSGVDASISNIGGQGSGPITIRHGGGLLDRPFRVGEDFTITENGTAAAITSANGNTIAPTQVFPFTYRQGNISILTLDPPNELTLPEEFPAPPPEELDTTIDRLVPILERTFTGEITEYYDYAEGVEIKSLGQIRQELVGIEAQTSGEVRPAIIYAFFVDPGLNLEELQRVVNQARQSYGQAFSTDAGTTDALEPDDATDETRPEWEYSSEERATEFSTIQPYLSSNDNESGLADRLALLLVTGRSEPVLEIPNVTRQDLLRTVPFFNADLGEDGGDWDGWQRRARQLHEWLIDPLEDDLEGQDITSIGFIIDTVLRSLPTAATVNPDPAAYGSNTPAHVPFRSSPIAVLQDEEGRYLVEKYSIGLIPSMSLIDVRYRDLRDAPVLAMGTDDFLTLPNLPGVRSEIEYVDSTWPGKSLVDDAFTVGNLESESKNGFRVIHLATHAFFNEGEPGDSYIQFSGQEQLNLNEVRSILDLRNVTPSIDLLVLSACQTALGNRDAELGFAGFAFQSGARSVLASLQSVSDEGTVGLITQFYQNLPEQPTKVEALRQAQLSLINGEVYIENGELVWEGPQPGRLPMYGSLPSSDPKYLDHPYYWAWFTIVGSPW